MTTIVLINEYGCLISEAEYDTDNGNEALAEFLKDNTVEAGDRIQIRR